MKRRSFLKGLFAGIGARALGAKAKLQADAPAQDGIARAVKRGSPRIIDSPGLRIDNDRPAGWVFGEYSPCIIHRGGVSTPTETIYAGYTIDELEQISFEFYASFAGAIANQDVRDALIDRFDEYTPGIVVTSPEDSFFLRKFEPLISAIDKT